MATQSFNFAGLNIVRVPEQQQPLVTPAFQDGPLSGALRMIALGVPVAWTKAGEKTPPMPGFPELATTDREQVMQWAAERPGCNWICVARSNGYCFLDEDDSERIRALYEKTFEEPYPRTWTTESRPGHRQSIWKQAAATRKLGNKVQGDFKDGIMSFRQNGEYVLAAMSHLNPNDKDGTGHRDYVVVDDSPIIEMPEYLIDLIYSLLIPKSQQTTAKSLAANPEAMISEHYRNDTLFRVASKWWENGSSEDSIRFDLHAMNEERCSPRLPREEVDGIVDGICKRYKQGDPAQDIIIFAPPNLRVATAQGEEAKPPEWRTPQDVSDGLPPVMPFDIRFLPRCLQPWALDTAQRMSVPLDFTGVSMIVAVAGAIGRRAFVYPKALDKEWKEAISVSGAVCASSGKLKTPVFKLFMNPFDELEADWAELKAKEWAIYNRALSDYKAAAKAAKVQSVEFLDEPPKEPEPSRRIILNDSTPEMAHDIMARNPAGILLYRDEFASWVAELSQEGRESQRGLYLAAMNGNDKHSVDRISRGHSKAIMCASLYGGFQPELLKEFLGDLRNQHDGLLARFGALCWPDSEKIPLIDRAVNDGAKQAYRHVIQTLAKLGPKAITLHFTADAQEVFDAWRERHTEKTDRETNLAKQSHLAKYHGLLPKLAGLLMLADLAILPEHHVLHGRVEVITNGLQGNHYIDLEHLNQAIRLIAYFESHMDRVYACIKDENQLAEETLAAKIRNGDLKDVRQGRDGEQRGFSSYDIQRRHWKHLNKQGVIEYALDALEDKGWVRLLPTTASPKGGRPAYRWEINPSVKT